MQVSHEKLVKSKIETQEKYISFPVLLLNKRKVLLREQKKQSVHKLVACYQNIKQ